MSANINNRRGRHGRIPGSGLVNAKIITAYVDGELYDTLISIAERYDISTSALVRGALGAYARNETRPAPTGEIAERGSDETWDFKPMIVSYNSSIAAER